MNIDRIAKIMAPAVMELDPPQAFRMRQALNVALDPDGRINPDSIPVFRSHILWFAEESSTSATTSDTVNYSDAIVIDDKVLPDYGTWQVVVDVGGTIANSLGSNIDVELVLNGDVVESVTVSSPAIADGGAHVRLGTIALNMAAGTAIDARLQIKPDTTGSATMRRSVMRIDADRMY